MEPGLTTSYRASDHALRKTVRYAGGSAVVFSVSEAVLVGLLAVGWTAVSASVASCVAGGVPGYFINRNWVWQQRGRSHFWREVVPFWASAFVGLVFATAAADAAEAWAYRHLDTRFWQIAVIAAAATTITGLLWIAKFALFNWFVFAPRRPAEPDA